MRRKEAKNYLYNLAYQFVSIIYPIVLTPYTARIFGADGVGDYSFTVAINTLFTLSLTCVERYGFREISYSRGDRKAESKSFWEVQILRFILLIFLSLGYLLLTFHSGKYKFLFLAQTISLLYVFFDIAWYWQGKENFKRTAIISIIVKILMLILVFLFVKNKDDLALYAFLISLVSCFGSFALWLGLHKEIGIPDNINIRKHIKSCILISIPFIIIELYSFIDKTMIGLIANDSFENGYYEQTIKITRIIMVIITSMSLIKAPRHSEFAKNNKRSELVTSLHESFSFMLFLGLPITFGLCLIADKCVPVFLGDGYEKVVILMYLYSPFVILHGFVDVMANQYFIPSKQQNKYTVAVGISCLVNIALNCVLISRLGAIGAIIATVISETVGLMVLVRFSRGIISLKKIIMENWQFLLAAVVMSGICLTVSLLINPGQFTEIMIQILLGIIVYFIFLTVCRQKYFMGLVSLLYNEVQRKTGRK